MDKETENYEEEDFDIDKLLHEEGDSPIEEEIIEETQEKPEKKSRGRPKGAVKKKEEAPKVSPEIAQAEKELSSMDWQLFSQAAYDGYRNIKTGEIIDSNEALRRALCYAEEAARNTR